jgi:hypothetical protein
MPAWRPGLGRDVSVLLVLKAAALGLLWWLFFSPAHQFPVDAAAASRRLAVKTPPASQQAASGAHSGDQP